MARKVIIDCDPGIDDAVALCLALFEPRLEVIAVTATEGNVSASLASRNVQAVIDQLDPPRFPRIGVATPPDHPPAVNTAQFNGSDGLGNSGIAVSEHHHQHASEKIICDEVRAAPEEVTIVCLGPLTNVARAFQRDPEIATLVNRLIIMGGSVNGGGNVTASAEFNIFYDPESARIVFRSATTKTLIPLDVTRRVRFTLGVLEELPDETTRAGHLLRNTLPFAFRAYHQTLGQESIYLHDCVALVSAIHPELFEMQELSGDVETRGELTRGATIFDRRPKTTDRPNMEVAMEVDAAGVRDTIVRGIHSAGRGS